MAFNVQGSVHRKYIPLVIFPTRCNITQFIYFWKTALHVSGGISAHHQEHIQLYLQYLALVNRYCYLPLLWESWSWSECGVGIVPICDVSHRSVHLYVCGWSVLDVKVTTYFHIEALVKNEWKNSYTLSCAFMAYTTTTLITRQRSQLSIFL